jgi:hypothetical protein
MLILILGVCPRTISVVHRRIDGYLLSQDIRADANFITILTHERGRGALDVNIEAINDVFDVRKLDLAVRIYRYQWLKNCKYS